jgi:hypothetical protein
MSCSLEEILHIFSKEHVSILAKDDGCKQNSLSISRPFLLFCLAYISTLNMDAVCPLKLLWAATEI